MADRPIGVRAILPQVRRRTLALQRREGSQRARCVGCGAHGAELEAVGIHIRAEIGGTDLPLSPSPARSPWPSPRAPSRKTFQPRRVAQPQRALAWRGLWLVAHCWGVIALAMLMGALWPLTIPLAVVIIGTRQLGLFILMHDGAHGLLHPNRRINDGVAHWLCSSSLVEYRPYHLQHHRYVQQAEDPDLGLSAPFPISRASLKRKLLRDLSGQTFYKQRLAPLLDADRR